MNKSNLIFAFLTITLLLASCKNQPKTNQKNNQQTSYISNEDTIRDLPLPKIPGILTDQQAKLDYLIDHYWDQVDFNDTTTLYDQGMLEQYWVNYIDRIITYRSDEYEKILADFMSRLNQGDKKNFSFYTDLADKYLYYPTSPLRNDKLYRSICIGMLNSQYLIHEDKERVQLIIELIDKNNIGDKAENFSFHTADGKTYQLNTISNEFTILFFYNPDCNICAHALSILKSSQTISFLKEKKRLQIIAICPDGNSPEWKNHIKDFPSNWINGYDPNLTLYNKNLYDLRGIPSLYLLDKNNKVLVKDAQVEEVLNRLEELL